MPEDKRRLVRLLKERKMTVFRPSSKTHVDAHLFSHPQNYLPEDWSSQSNANVTYMACFRELFMEPYVMVKKTSFLPPFDESFLGLTRSNGLRTCGTTGTSFTWLPARSPLIFLTGRSWRERRVTHRSRLARAYRHQFFCSPRSMVHVYRHFLKKLREQPDRSRQLLCLSRGRRGRDR